MAQVLKFQQKTKLLKFKFTDKAVASLSYDGEQTDYIDALPPLSGASGVLGVRVGKRTKTFFIRYAINGKRRRFTIGRYPDLSLADARTKAAKKLSEVNNGIDVAETRIQYKNSPIFSDLWTEYNRYIDRQDRIKLKAGKKPRSPRSRRHEERRYDTKFKPLHDIRVCDLSQGHLVFASCTLGESLYSQDPRHGLT